MPGNNRIRRLLDLLPGDLSQAKLDTLSREFDALAQDSAEVLPCAGVAKPASPTAPATT